MQNYYQGAMMRLGPFWCQRERAWVRFNETATGMVAEIAENLQGTTPDWRQVSSGLWTVYYEEDHKEQEILYFQLEEGVLYRTNGKKNALTGELAVEICGAKRYQLNIARQKANPTNYFVPFHTRVKEKDDAPALYEQLPLTLDDTIYPYDQLPLTPEKVAANAEHLRQRWETHQKNPNPYEKYFSLITDSSFTETQQAILCEPFSIIPPKAKDFETPSEYYQALEAILADRSNAKHGEIDTLAANTYLDDDLGLNKEKDQGKRLALVKRKKTFFYTLLTKEIEYIRTEFSLSNPLPSLQAENHTLPHSSSSSTSSGSSSSSLATTYEEPISHSEFAQSEPSWYDYQQENADPYVKHFHATNYEASSFDETQRSLLCQHFATIAPIPGKFGQAIDYLTALLALKKNSHLIPDIAAGLSRENNLKSKTVGDNETQKVLITSFFENLLDREIEHIQTKFSISISVSLWQQEKEEYGPRSTGSSTSSGSSSSSTTRSGPSSFFQPTQNDLVSDFESDHNKLSWQNYRAYESDQATLSNSPFTQTQIATLRLYFSRITPKPGNFDIPWNYLQALQRAKTTDAKTFQHQATSTELNHALGPIATINDEGLRTACIVSFFENLLDLEIQHVIDTFFTTEESSSIQAPSIPPATTATHSSQASASASASTSTSTPAPAPAPAPANSQPAPTTHSSQTQTPAAAVIPKDPALVEIQTKLEAAKNNFERWYSEQYFVSSLFAGLRPSGKSLRGANGVFSYWKHNSRGQRYMRELYAKVSAAENTEDAIDFINGYLTNKRTNYNAHSGASFALDELRQIPRGPWANIPNPNRENRYDKKTVSDTLNPHEEQLEPL